jgi:hypothetical protein
MTTDWKSLSPSLVATAHSLRIDAATATVVPALEAAGIRSIVLKGPALTRWLYDDGTPRPYADTDLLVAPDQLADAEHELSSLDFKKVAYNAGSEHASNWERKDGAWVDLHHSLPGVGVSPTELWQILAGELQTISIGGVQAQILGRHATALHLALHAIQHGPSWSRPLEDLERALQRFPFEVWESASLLAARLKATAAFAAGLRLLPIGETVASQLGLPVERSVRLILAAEGPLPMALGFEALGERRGLRAKLSFLGRELFPPRSFMRVWSPTAMRGRFGLLLAYLWRPLWLFRHGGPALRAWRRARQQARH